MRRGETDRQTQRETDVRDMRRLSKLFACKLLSEIGSGVPLGNRKYLPKRNT